MRNQSARVFSLWSLVAFLLMTAGALSYLANNSAAADIQPQLHLRKANYTLDGSGNVYLRLLFINDGTVPIGVTAFAPAREGPWTEINQKVDPGALVRGAIKVGNDAPTAIWVDSSQGLLRFDLPKHH